MEEYRFDSTGENARRLPVLLIAIIGSLLGMVAAPYLAQAIVVTPICIFVYILQRVRYHRHRNDRIVTEDDQLFIWEGGRERQVPRAAIRRVWEANGLLFVQLENEIIEVKFPVENQESLLAKLGP